MNTFATIGVTLLGALITIWLAVWLWAMVRSEIGRGILTGLALLLIVAWGVFGGIWLWATHS